MAAFGGGWRRLAADGGEKLAESWREVGEKLAEKEKVQPAMAFVALRAVLFAVMGEVRC